MNKIQFLSSLSRRNKIILFMVIWVVFYFILQGLFPQIIVFPSIAPFGMA